MKPSAAFWRARLIGLRNTLLVAAAVAVIITALQLIYQAVVNFPVISGIAVIVLLLIVGSFACGEQE